MSKLRKAALLSVTDKRGIAPIGQGLVDKGYTILSTGGTAANLRQNNIPVTEVSAYTEFPEMMDGRLKTLHPFVYGGILARRGIDEQVMLDNGMQFLIDVVVCNLYAFEKTVASGCTYEEATESIDIGGPSMIRAAAKNEADVAVLTNPNQYNTFLGVLDNPDELEMLKRRLSAEAFTHTALYDTAIAKYKSDQL